MMTFQLTDDQEQKFADWSAKHERVYTGAIGGRYEFSFLDTSLGTFVNVRDCVTDKVLDLSDVS